MESAILGVAVSNRSGAPECRAYWDDQIAVFDSVLAACQAAGGRIMSLHSRRAATQVLDGLQRFPGAGTAIFHWFSGTPRELERAAGERYWFSVGPAMLASAKGRALAAAMPPDRILTETDGPFAQVKGAAALPWDCKLAVAGLADLWGQQPEETEKELKGNLRRLTGMLTT